MERYQPCEMSVVDVGESQPRRARQLLRFVGQPPPSSLSWKMSQQQKLGRLPRQLTLGRGLLSLDLVATPCPAPEQRHQSPSAFLLGELIFVGSFLAHADVSSLSGAGLFP